MKYCREFDFVSHILGPIFYMDNDQFLLQIFCLKLFISAGRSYFIFRPFFGGLL